jgi:ABC-2 type transport system permease protein
VPDVGKSTPGLVVLYKGSKLMQNVEVIHKDSVPIYDSTRRGSAEWEELRGAFQYRDLVFQLIRRNIVARYKRSVLGIAWTMLKPLGIMLVMTIVFSQIFHGIKGYPSYILSGLIIWNFFSLSTTASMQQMAWGGILFHRIYMPRTTFTIASVGTELVNLFLSLIPLVVILLIVGIKIHLSIFFVFVSLIFISFFSLGVSLMLSAFSVYFPDLVEMYQVVLTAWMYLTPIIYPKDTMPAHFQWIFYVNPMYYMVEIFRQPVYDGVLPEIKTFFISAVISIVALIAGWIFFSRKADEFAYYA